MFSMTGFGRGEAVFNTDCRLTAEVSSVNRKQLEIRVIAPPELAAYEPRIRRIVTEHFNRGAVQLRLNMRLGAGPGSAAAQIDEALLDELIDGALEARRRAGLPDTVAVETLMTLPGVLVSGETDVEAPGFSEALERAVADACSACREMRRREGTALQEDLRRRGTVLREFLARLEPECAKLPEIAKKRLLGKLADAAVPMNPDDETLVRELLFYADKSDVAEEITRLKSHFSQLEGFLADERPAGRSLDFLAQEFFREITTLGNKAASPSVSPLVVAFKSELEKMREQIQNVE